MTSAGRSARILGAWTSRTTSSSRSPGARTRSSSSSSASGRGGLSRPVRGLPGGGRVPVGDPRRRRADRRLRFGYGNPAMLRSFRIPPETAERYTLLEALPPMRDSRAFRSYVEVCDTGAPVNEVTYDTPFGDGYMLGTFVHRIHGGDGLIVFLTDVTEERRMEAELKLRRRGRARPERAPRGHGAAGRPARAAPEEPPPATCSSSCGRAPTRPRPHRRRARLCARGRAGPRARRARRRDGRGRRRPAAALEDADATRSWASCRRWRAIRASCAACCRTSSATRSSSAREAPPRVELSALRAAGNGW